MTKSALSFPADAKKIWRQLTNNITAEYPEGEKQSLSYMLMEHFLALNKANIIANSQVVVDASTKTKIMAALDRLNENEPIQYVLGYTEFYGLKIAVNQSVLIPRPETEELVALIIAENPEFSASLLDVGTGSGCIPLAIKSHFPNATVYGLDIDLKAVDCAKANAERLGLEVVFENLDLLHQELPYESLDIVVSNPPYVLEKEKKLMHNNVLDYEPALALFVPDDKPLLFYASILENIGPKLVKGGKIYFEINEQYGNEVKDLLTKSGYEEVRIIKDIFEKDRMVMARKK